MKFSSIILTILSLALIISCGNLPKQNSKNIETDKDKLQVLLVGSSHWNNYESGGYDVAQTNEVDILSEQYQKELELITDKIAQFNPDKIFVERERSYQPKLDSLYKLYQSSDWGKDKRNEIVQLGFRVAAKLNHKRVFGIDYRNTSFPYDSLMTAMKLAKQEELIQAFTDDIQDYEESYNSLIRDKKTLAEIFYFLNDSKQRKIDVDWYLSGANKAGTKDNNIGSFLASDWIKRNIYSYGLIQKYVESKDERIMILMGASHIAVFETLMQSKADWNAVELKQIIEE